MKIIALGLLVIAISCSGREQNGMAIDKITVIQTAGGNDTISKYYKRLDIDKSSIDGGEVGVNKPMCVSAKCPINLPEIINAVTFKTGIKLSRIEQISDSIEDQIERTGWQNQKDAVVMYVMTGAEVKIYEGNSVDDILQIDSYLVK